MWRLTMFLTATAAHASSSKAPPLSQAVLPPSHPCARVDHALLPRGFLAISSVLRGSPFCIFLHDELHDAWLSKTIYRKGRLHAAEEKFIESSVRHVLSSNPDGWPSNNGKTRCKAHVLDIGGNIGWMTLFAASISPDVCVTVVEPFTWHNSLLNASVNLNQFGHRVHLVKALVGTKVGDPLCMVPDPSNGASTEVKAEYDATTCAQRGGEMIPSTTIDEVLAQSPFGQHVDVMKMDVEGFEPMALAGATTMLRERPPKHIAMEWIGWRIEKQLKRQDNGASSCDPVSWLNTKFPTDQWQRKIANGPTGESKVSEWLATWREAGSPFHKGGDILLTNRRL